MKRHVQLPGVRKWAGEDFIELQSEPLKALDGFFAQYGPCIVQGVKVTANGKFYNLTEGLVCLKGENHEKKTVTMIVPFKGAKEVVLPLYLMLKYKVKERVYADEKVKPVAYEYYADHTTVAPANGVPYLELKPEGNTHFTDVLQDDYHNFITHQERLAWNAKAEKDDPRFTDARKADGGNADTVGGIAPAAVGKIEKGKLASYDANGYLSATALRDELPENNTANLASIAYRSNSNSTDTYLRYCSPARFRSQVTDGHYQKEIEIPSEYLHPGQHVILLAPMYESTLLTNTLVMGMFTATRGGFNQTNRKIAAQVVCGSAYSSYTSSCLSFSEPSYLASCVYEGKKYLALVFGDSGMLLHSFRFSGRMENGTNDPNFMKAVSAESVSSIVKAAGNVHLDTIWTHENFDPNSKVDVTDSRLTDARKANGGNADTVGGIAPAAVGTIKASSLASYNQHGYFSATALRDELPLNDTAGVNAIAYRVNNTGTDTYLRYCSPARFRAQITDNYYFKHQKAIAESDMDNIAHYDKSGTFGISRGEYGTQLINFVSSGTSTSPVQLYVDHYTNAGRSLSWRNGVDNNRFLDTAWRKIWDSKNFDPSTKADKNVVEELQAAPRVVWTGTITTYNSITGYPPSFNATYSKIAMEVMDYSTTESKFKIPFGDYAVTASGDYSVKVHSYTYGATSYSYISLQARSRDYPSNVIIYKLP